MSHKVDFYFAQANKWQDTIAQLRSIVLDCGLNEELKWGCPCYTYNDNNIVLIHVFKEYCALLFFKGALLKDSKGILVQQTKNVQAARQLRFTAVAEVTKQKAAIKAYIYEAIEVEKAGLKVTLKKTTEFEVAEEFQKTPEEEQSPEDSLRSIDTRQTAGLSSFLYIRQTSRYPGSKDREIYTTNHAG